MEQIDGALVDGFREKRGDRRAVGGGVQERSRRLSEIVILKAPELGQLICSSMRIIRDFTVFWRSSPASGDRRGRAVFLVVPDVKEAPEEFLAGRVDDVHGSGRFGVWKF